MDVDVDVAIVGAGPCGLAAAISAMRAGLSVQVFDKGPVVSTIIAYPTYATFFSTAEKLSIGGLPFVLAAAKPTRQDALAYYRAAVTHFGIPVRQYEVVERITGSAGDFTVHARSLEGVATVRCRAVIVATGYFGAPNALGVPGESLPHVSHVYREGHEAFQRTAVVAGGGNSAAEAALDLWRVGSRVTLVHFGPTWDKRIKPWVLPDVTNRIDEGGIAVRWNSRVAAIEPGWVTIEPASGGEAERIRGEHVYLMTGFAPDLALLRDTGCTVDPATGVPAHDPGTLETDVPGVYMVGVLVAGYDANQVFIENGRFHGDRIVAHLTGRPVPASVPLSGDPDA
ncbi:MAG: YpdA family putative bacillithiol disulfide reductase [Gemmatimonadaceae bacterium]|nr:YpdA family putative bacillithiol disulfide reductase [Gemmatimonadaceae bacterium]